MRDTFSNVTSLSSRMTSLERKVDALIKISSDPSNTAFKDRPNIDIDKFNISSVSQSIGCKYERGSVSVMLLEIYD